MIFRITERAAGLIRGKEIWFWGILGPANWVLVLCDTGMRFCLCLELCRCVWGEGMRFCVCGALQM